MPRPLGSVARCLQREASPILPDDPPRVFRIEGQQFVFDRVAHGRQIPGSARFALHRRVVDPLGPAGVGTGFDGRNRAIATAAKHRGNQRQSDCKMRVGHRRPSASVNAQLRLTFRKEPACPLSHNRLGTPSLAQPARSLPMPSMYEIDPRDSLAPAPAPQSDVGAPLPRVLATEHSLFLLYLVHEPEPGWDGTSVKIMSPTTDALVCIVSFERAYAHFSGPPNDEAMQGHPLAACGLKPYSSFEVKDSSWVRKAERMNRVHEHHRPEAFAGMRHFIFTFHDSTFESLARGYTVTTARGSIEEATRRVLGELHT